MHFISESEYKESKIEMEKKLKDCQEMFEKMSEKMSESSTTEKIEKHGPEVEAKVEALKKKMTTIGKLIFSNPLIATYY
jgi:hypothetical protein